MERHRRAALFVAVMLTVSAVLPLRVESSELRSDESILFFPTAARLSEDGAAWQVPVHAWVFEMELNSLWRRPLLNGLVEALGLEGDAADSEVFRARARWFLADNERGKAVTVTLSEDTRPLGLTRANGHLRGEVRLQRITDAAEQQSFWLSYTAELPAGDSRVFRGETLFVPPQGLSVISDIDDTIKISQVRDKKALLRNSFLEPFRAVPGMAAAYARLAEADAVFHYVSSSPWQLYPPLAAFLDQAGFPRGSFHLRDFRLKDESFFNLFKSSQVTKPPVIEGLLAAYPQRRFVLIGDSGEVDPEIYGEIARRHPARIAAIYIRRVTPGDRNAERYGAAFAGLPDELWALFDDPRTIGAPP